MKQLKRLQTLEKRLNEVYQAKDLEEEYLSWIKEHPMSGVNELSFDFDQWLDSMPPRLIPHFQWQLRQIRPLS